MGGNVKSFMLAYDLNTTAYMQKPLVYFSLITDIQVIHTFLAVDFGQSLWIIGYDCNVKAWPLDFFQNPSVNIKEEGCTTYEISMTLIEGYERS